MRLSKSYIYSFLTIELFISIFYGIQIIGALLNQKFIIFLPFFMFIFDKGLYEVLAEYLFITFVMFLWTVILSYDHSFLREHPIIRHFVNIAILYIAISVHLVYFQNILLYGFYDVVMLSLASLAISLFFYLMWGAIFFFFVPRITYLEKNN